MALRPCITCGVLQRESYCASCRPSRNTPGRGSGTQIMRFRNAVLTRAGHQCEAIVNGTRCGATTGIQAHHAKPLRKGGTNDAGNGVALCGEHHRAVEKSAA